jgi:P4 family phage/plasmid primase-like protien
MLAKIMNQTVTYVKGFAVWDGPNRQHKIQSMTLVQWIEAILKKDDEKDKLYTELREMDRDARNVAKGTKVPLVMGSVAATSTKHIASITEYSGFVMVDIDGALDVPDMIRRMKESDLFLAGWRSLSYEGCHGIVLTDTKANGIDQFRRIASFVYEGLADFLGLTMDESVYPHIDPAEKNPVQGLSLSYDPELGFMNEKAIMWTIPEDVLEEEQQHSYIPIENTNMEEDDDRLISHIEKLINNIYNLANGGRFKGVGKMCVTIGGYSAGLAAYKQEEIIKRCIQAYKDIDPSRKDHAKVCESGFRRGLQDPLDLPIRSYYKKDQKFGRPAMPQQEEYYIPEHQVVTPTPRQICSRCSSKKVSIYQWPDGKEANLCNRCLHSIKAIDRPLKVDDYPEAEKKRSLLDKAVWELYADDLKAAYYWHASGRDGSMELRYCPRDNIDDRIRIKLENDDGVKLWRPNGEHCIGSYAAKCYEEMPVDDNGSKPKITTIINETMMLVKKACVLEPWSGYKERPGVIPFKDGILQITDFSNWNDVETRPYRAEDYFMVDQVLPVNWVHPKNLPPAAKDGIFTDMIRNYDLPKEKVTTLYQMIGLSMICHYYKQKLFVISGPGKNGKTILAAIISKILGTNNCCSVVPQSLKHGSFSAVNLLGKLANLSDDFPSDELKDLSVLKGLSGNSTFTAMRKYKSDIEFKNYATLIFICNLVPVVNVSEDAWWRRVLPFELNKQFPPGHPQRIENAEARIMETPNNDPGLLNLIGEAVQAVWNMYKFQTEMAWNPNEAEVKDIWDRLSNSLVEFIDLHCERDESYQVSLREFHTVFNKWWTRKIDKNRNPHNPLGHKQIFKFMDLLGFTQEKSNSFYGSNTPGVRFWVGLKIKEESISCDFDEEENQGPQFCEPLL